MANTEDNSMDNAVEEHKLDDAQLDDSLAPEHYDASDLRVLEGLEAVRIRPGMYIGSTGPRGLHHLVYEIVDNSVDEALAGYASHIEVTILPDNAIRVVDDGRGIPVDEVPGEGVSGVETVMTKLHAGGKFGGGGYAVSGGLHGVGISVVNALSTRVEIEVRRQGFHWTQTYVDQHPTAPLAKGEPMAEGESTGTSVTFWPDGTIFETTVYDFETLRSRFQQMAFLNKGLKISLTDLRKPDEAGDEVAGDSESSSEEKHRSVSYQYEHGIKDYVDYLVKSRKAVPVEPDVIDFEAEDLEIGISAEIAMQWTVAYSEAVHTFANTISTTEGGTHEEGFRAALTTLVNRYAREKNILKEKDTNLSGDDVREGLTAVVSVKLTTPQFEGQTKTKLGNSEAKTFVQRVMTEKLGDWFDAHPNEAKNIIQKAIEASRARLAAKKARENTRRKSIFETAGMPDKLKDCQSSNPEECELFIVEGDSAGGSAIQGRDPITQAILPLRGKILNTERASIDRMMKSETIESLITAVGGGYGEDFDLSKVRYHKVIIMADADVDGAHIATLNLTLFFRYMRPMITAGYVYVAMPPLYRLKWSKGAHDFVYTDAERDRVLAEGKAAGRQLPKGEGIQRYKGLGEMSYQELWETTMDPEHRILKQIHIEDAARADETFSMLMGDEVEPRRLFIQRNAHDARFIDA
ncbi:MULTISPECIES: DNA topoisomerase (ATP-hydrolyzing) subunit B [Gardnerella]|uniref:DNA topoisomerase (ATP-hydrolyzing) n=5 Tax=Gardnerella TaxID=2701 RepID=A0AAP8LRT2_GARVA|nr:MULTISPECIES: DNA topoisomerase (ATP-hydrolyzing) subunit B [Gardnerella]ADB14507.1 DNA gyrase, B subunit [Gardnerella vaginalis 409-05]EFH27495.1 type IIA topoisomerase (DNA gyrase/topo II, topoisomerase IV), B subunit [Gardnerella vaginalis AMD]EFH71308.1 type IIA topoisomerase (DNA gyrase/topo II, topoisomerase IV), B subunit [Gardnerella vaginalis 5-1]EIK78194.1 DNA gyrase subunit B [Gardnerella vaginalis 6420B]NSX31701.1 DNA topoisomerase (ATP-hydrolyzing) subunit B [Gardnerella vagina